MPLLIEHGVPAVAGRDRGPASALARRVAIAAALLALLPPAAASLAQAAESLAPRLAVSSGSAARQLETNRPATLRTAPPRVKGTRLAVPKAPGADTQPVEPGGSPEITAVSPAGCVRVGQTATATGANLGSSGQAAGFSLGYQVEYEGPAFELETAWSQAGIGFTVPPGVEPAGGLYLGIIYEGTFYFQVYAPLCGHGSGGGDGGSYSGDGDGGSPDSGGGAVNGPKGARALAPGGVTIQIEPSPASAASVPGQPQPASRAVGGKLLAMKALAGRGLRKLNKECDVYDRHCPCCRVDDSVCLEKESDNQDGTSTWVVRWQAGAKTADGRGAYVARSAEDDLEAVTGLQCEPAAGGAHDAGGSAGVATLTCR